MARNSPSGGEKLGFLGLAAVTPYLDYILFPLLAIFLILALYGWWRRKEHG